MKFKDFQAPILFSSTFKALNLREKLKYFQRCVGTLVTNRHKAFIHIAAKTIQDKILLLTSRQI